MMIDEIQIIIDEEVVPPGNLFFLDNLLPDEKRYLIDAGKISDMMIRNRLQYTDI